MQLPDRRTVRGTGDNKKAAGAGIKRWNDGQGAEQKETGSADYSGPGNETCSWKAYFLQYRN